MNILKPSIACLALSLFANIPLNLEKNITFSNDLKVLSSTSIRNDETNLCLKLNANIPNSYLPDPNFELGFISMSLYDIADRDEFTLDNKNIKIHNVNQDEIILKDNQVSFASYLDIDENDFTLNYAVRSFLKTNNTITYSSNIEVFNYYRICEKIEHINNDKESIINIAKNNKALNDNGLVFEFDSTKQVYKIIGFNELNLLDNTVIPSYYNNYPVEEIAANAFLNSTLKTVFIPSTLSIIGENAFKNCDSLTIYVEDNEFKKDWNVNFNSSLRPIYYDFINRRNHKSYISNDNQIKMDNYIHQIIKEGNAAFNQENYPIYKFHYSDAVMMSALLDIYDVNHDLYYLNSAVNDMNNFINLKKGTWKYKPSGGQLDSIPGGDVLLRLAKITNNQKYKTFSQRMLDILVASHRIEAESGNFWHKNNYENQVWLDGLYMAMPFYARYETEYNNHKNYEDIYKQYKFVYDTLRNKENGLYYHGYDHSGVKNWSKHNQTNPKCSLSFWGRAIGWLVASLANVINVWDASTENEKTYKEFLEKMLKEAIESVYNYADPETNLFYQVIDKQNETGNYLETSASSLICFATLKANRLGILSEEYYQKGLATFEGLLNHKMQFSKEKNRYVLKDVNKVAGLDDTSRPGTYEYYISESVVEDNAKGSGPLLMAYAEILR